MNYKKMKPRRMEKGKCPNRKTREELLVS